MQDDREEDRMSLEQAEEGQGDEQQTLEGSSTPAQNDREVNQEDLTLEGSSTPLRNDREADGIAGSRQRRVEGTRNKHSRPLAL